jgi:hypothetical protein
MEEKKRIGYFRSFLNEPYLTSLTSHISYTVELKSYNEELKKEGKYDYTKIEFSIADCSKNIYLDFDIESKDDMRNSLHKLDTIIEACQKFKEDLKTARKELLVGQKRAKELAQEKLLNKNM